MGRWAKYVAGFVTVAVLGLVVRAPEEIPVIGEAVNPWPARNLLVVIALSALIAFVAGYMLPKAFWLWGVAVVALRVPVEMVLLNHDVEAGYVSGSQVGSLLFVVGLIYFGTVVFGTVASRAGAGLRSLWLRRRVGLP